MIFVGLITGIASGHRTVHGIEQALIKYLQMNEAQAKEPLLAMFFPLILYHIESLGILPGQLKSHLQEAYSDILC